MRRDPGRVAIAGASGFLGQALTARLQHGGHAVLPISRRAAPGVVRWDPAHGALDPAALTGVTAIVNLAGANIARGRWTAARKRELVASRLDATSLLVRTIHAMAHPPDVLVSVSGINYYGDRGDELLDEHAPPGHDFLAELCVEWEAAAEPARQAGVRVVLPRIGVVLDATEGALGRLLPFFRAGLGGRLGDGRQWMSWIAIDDVVGAVLHVLEHPIDGPVNVVGPSAVRNREFTATLAEVLRRPAVIPVPALPLRLAFGEIVDAVLLAGQRVQPAALLATGYAFEFAALAPALRHLLGPG
jgi:uncharacterized protein